MNKLWLLPVLLHSGDVLIDYIVHFVVNFVIVADGTAEYPGVPTEVGGLV